MTWEGLIPGLLVLALWGYAFIPSGAHKGGSLRHRRFFIIGAAGCAVIALIGYFLDWPRLMAWAFGAAVIATYAGSSVASGYLDDRDRLR